MLHPIEIAIGYVFRDPQWLAAALRHRSMPQDAAERDNERLEFLGDAVLDLAIRSLLFRHDKSANEGTLTRWRSYLASRSALARIGGSIGLLEHVERVPPSQTPHAVYEERVLANTFEALMGALYWDGGYSQAREVAERLLESALLEMEAEPYHGNYKTALQELWQGKTGKLPHYELAGKKGPAHAPHFEVRVRLGKQVGGVGFGWSKREASQNAAKDALERLHSGEFPFPCDMPESDSLPTESRDTLRGEGLARKESRMEPEYVTVKEAAEIFRVSPQTVRRWVGKGELPSVKIGRTVRIPKHALANEDENVNECDTRTPLQETEHPYLGKSPEERRAYAKDLIARLRAFGKQTTEKYGPASQDSVAILRELREERLDRIEGKRRTYDE